MPLPRIACIYRITNTVTGKHYIGSTLDLKERIGKHISKLNEGTHHSAKLQSSWAKHGAGAFSVHLVKYVHYPKELYLWEDHFIRIYNGFGWGYNMTQSSIGNRGYRHTEEQKAKNRAGKAYAKIHGKKVKPPTKKSKGILRYTQDGLFLDEFESQQIIQRTFGYSATNISMCANGVIRQAFGYLWKFKESEDFPKRIPPMRPDGHSVPVMQFTPEGEFVAEYLSGVLATKALGLYSSAVSDAINKKCNTTGYIWKFSHDVKHEPIRN
ncbi:GIY-YIG nuclease family protein [Hymenobacter sp. M29]|uniref:GIY-YIG nuclease family protein n=1 Tax=Hymenobacter mellowenesis TaxID=3063995 RepID=A0ABT9ACU8_9BACT|nr:GIY-YIG nuclease family protein [Hymenobacter sp. M29]MDO7847660.1 GIY-YIG nuclease family protein [Hymenobacter sp. M29]